MRSVGMTDGGAYALGRYDGRRGRERLRNSAERKNKPPQPAEAFFSYSVVSVFSFERSPVFAILYCLRLQPRAFYITALIGATYVFT